jgi:hypothetical protein
VNISDDAVEAAAKANYEARTGKEWRFLDNFQRPIEISWMRRTLEAAAPILLSHERQLTADAHRDAIVNRGSVDRLERELENAKADAWDEGAKAGADYEYRTALAFERCTLEELTPAPNPYRSQA